MDSITFRELLEEQLGLSDIPTNSILGRPGDEKAKSALKKAGIQTVGAILNLDYSKIKGIRNKSTEAVIRALIRAYLIKIDQGHYSSKDVCAVDEVDLNNLITRLKRKKYAPKK
jgi:hypothetical protein